MLLFAALLSSIVIATTSFSSAQAATQSQLVVSSQNTAGTTINGYYTVLSDQNGNPSATGFTPATFALNNGQGYMVTVDNYGSCSFSHWADTGSTDAQRSVTITSNIQLTAIYNCSGSTGSVQLTINTVDSSGSPMPGYYVVLNQSSNIVATGFTSNTFTLNSGQTYTVQVDGYQSCVFLHWSDTGSVVDGRTVSITSDTELTAVIGCGSNAGTVSNIDVRTFDQNSDTIFGYYMTFSQGGQQIYSCYSECEQVVSNGYMYQIAVSDYGSCTFSHWNGGSTNRVLTVDLTNTGGASLALKEIAYYNCV